jgi:hypothetical protein
MNELNWENEDFERLNKFSATLGMNPWWTKNSNRLSLDGYKLITSLKFKEYRVSYPDTVVSSKVLLDLHRIMPSPYYIIKTNALDAAIYFFGAKEAMFALLCKDLDTFLKSYS